MDMLERLVRCTGSEWDEGDLLKNWERHLVSSGECEQVFFNRPLVAAPDEGHSGKEPRFYALGHTDADRYLFVLFTIRGRLVRVVSARDMNGRERKAYEAS
jgi:uncharacterized protein